MPEAIDPRPALERVLADPKAKPADIVKAAELLRAMGAVDQAADVLDLDDAALLRLARSGVTEGGGDQNEGPVGGPQKRVPSDAVSTPLPADGVRPGAGRVPTLAGRGRVVGDRGRGVDPLDGTQTDPSFYADPPGGCEIDPLS